MSDEFLSQEEIDALASGVLPESEEILPDVEESIKSLIETIKEQIVSVFSITLSLEVSSDIISINFYNKDKIGELSKDQLVSIATTYTGAIKGRIIYLMTKEDVAMISDLMMMGEGTTEWSDDFIESIGEAFNQIDGNLVTPLGNFAGGQIEISSAEVNLISLDDADSFSDFYLVMLKLTIGDKIDSQFAILIDPDIILKLQEKQQQATQESTADKVTVKTPDLEKFDQEEKQVSSGATELPKNIEMILDISLPVTIELGRTSMRIRDILELGHGSIVELDKLAGEPVDVIVNDKVIAKGEVVVIDENFGVRITSLVGMDERIKSLR